MNKKEFRDLRITDTRSYYKPFKYAWCFDDWLRHEQSHWIHTEVPMLDDVKDWKKAVAKGDMEQSEMDE